jgi:hypothetical protein
LQREAWERAVVNQSAAHIEAARLGKFSIAYAAQRDIGQLAFQGMTMLLSGTRMIDAINDADLGQVEPIEYLRVMRQYGAALGAVQSNLRDVEAQLQAALGEPAVSAARPPAAPSRTSPASR